MGSFDSRELEIIDLVYETVWERIVAREPLRDTTQDEERREALRKWVFDLAAAGPFDFETLCDKAIATMTE
jgi:hypothetical protein